MFVHLLLGGVIMENKLFIETPRGFIRLKNCKEEDCCYKIKINNISVFDKLRGEEIDVTHKWNKVDLALLVSESLKANNNAVKNIVFISENICKKKPYYVLRYDGNNFLGLVRLNTKEEIVIYPHNDKYDFNALINSLIKQGIPMAIEL